MRIAASSICNVKYQKQVLLQGILDAYARLYGLTRNELRYILDPQSKIGASSPSTPLGSAAPAANPYSASDNYKHFNGSVCGRLITGFSRPAHEKFHPSRKVEWKRV